MTIFELNILGLKIAPTYYGLMYVVGFLSGFYIIKNRKIIKNKILDSLLIYIVIGVILGGRIGYIILYNFNTYINDPLSIIKIWEGGMSFHGGIIGVILALLLFSKKFKLNFYKISDEIASVVTIGIGLGRLGNYMNKELLGFSQYYGPLNVNGKFPSPLVEMLLEGITLFIILNLIYKKKKFDGQIASLFLIFYSIFRIFVEAFFREPDEHIGYIFNYFTVGEIYSLPMLIAGIYFYIKLKNKNAK